MTITPFPVSRRSSVHVPAADAAYAELAVTSNFSFLRGASHPIELVLQAKKLGLAGIGIADRNSVAGVVRAYTAGQKAGLKVAVGARLVFADETPDILAYPCNRAGWGRLTRVLSMGKLRAEKGECILRFEDLLECAADINFIVMPRPGLKDVHAVLGRLKAAASKNAVWLAALLAYRGGRARRLSPLHEVGREAATPLIAVNDVLYHVARRRMLQDIV